MKRRSTSLAWKVRAYLTLVSIVSVFVVLTPNAEVRADWPDAPVEGLVSDSEDESTNGTVGMDDQGRFLAGSDTPRSFPPGGRHVYVLRSSNDGSVVGAKAALSEDGYGDVHFLPSLAMCGDSMAHVGWLGHQPSAGYTVETLLTTSFDFDQFTITTQRPPGPACAKKDYEPSAGILGNGPGRRTVATEPT